MRIPIRAVPYIRLAKRLFLGPGLPGEIAYQQDVLCPEEKTTIPPAICLPGQIDKVIEQKGDAWGCKTRDAAIAEATSTAVIHARTIAYHIKDAILLDGRIFAGRFKYPIAEASLFTSSSEKPVRIKTAALASSFLGTKYFGHWLTDDCTRHKLAENFGTPLCVRMPGYTHRQQYQTFFSQDWTSTDRAYIDHLVVFQDYSQNSSKRDRYKILRDQIRTRIPGRAANACVYLRRGQTGALRTIENEQEILDALTESGFIVLDIASDGLDHIIATLAGAKLVVSIEGSHVAHCTMTLPEKSGMLILEPPDRFSGVHRAQAGCLGVRFGFVVGTLSDNGYHFPPDDILRTIDLLLREIEARSS